MENEKLIIEQSMFTICLECGHVTEHKAAVATTLHFVYAEEWTKEFNRFCSWLSAQTNKYTNFNEAYIEYVDKEVIG